MRRTIAEQIAHKLTAIRNCERSENWEWRDHHAADLVTLVEEGPSGSGWDCGTQFDADNSDANKLVFFGSYHHMDEMGSYDGWTDHVITVRPDFVHKLDIKISGRDRSAIKDDLHQLFYFWLTSEHKETVDA
jgi:hypothetical protein